MSRFDFEEMYKELYRLEDKLIKLEKMYKELERERNERKIGNRIRRLQHVKEKK